MSDANEMTVGIMTAVAQYEVRARAWHVSIAARPVTERHHMQAAMLCSSCQRLPLRVAEFRSLASTPGA
jgi:hypothetical protein